MSGDSDALHTWRDKLAYLQRQEAIENDGSVKFKIRKDIEEAEARIAELSQSPSSDPDEAIEPAVVGHEVKQGPPELQEVISELPTQAPVAEGSTTEEAVSEDTTSAENTPSRVAIGIAFTLLLLVLVCLAATYWWPRDPDLPDFSWWPGDPDTPAPSHVTPPPTDRQPDQYLRVHNHTDEPISGFLYPHMYGASDSRAAGKNYIPIGPIPSSADGEIPGFFGGYYFVVIYGNKSRKERRCGWLDLGWSSCELNVFSDFFTIEDPVQGISIRNTPHSDVPDRERAP